MSTEIGADSSSAEATAPDVDAAAAEQYLTFGLGDELFASSIRVVREIIQTGALTTVPLMPGFVRGVINLRGAVVPVIDLQARLGRAPLHPGRKCCIVVFEVRPDGERLDIGLLVDAVSAVVEIDGAAIEAAPEFGAGLRRDYIRGLARLGRRFVTVLDPERVFDIDEMTRLCDAASWAAAA